MTGRARARARRGLGLGVGLVMGGKIIAPYFMVPLYYGGPSFARGALICD